MSNGDKATRALELAQQEIEDLIEQVRGVPDNELNILADSAFVLGFSKASARSTEREGTAFERSMVPAVRGAIDAIDACLQTSDPDPALISARNELSSAFEEYATTLRTILQEGLKAMHGERIAGLLCSTAPLTEEDCFDIGLAFYERAKAPFFGFVMFEDDDSVPCKCAVHLATALTEKNISVEEAQATMIRRFKSRAAAITFFGRFNAEQIRGEMTLDFRATVHAPPSEEEARKVYESFIGRAKRDEP